MREQFDNKLAQSVIEWLNNTITSEGGYSNHTGVLNLQADSTRANFKVYASPLRSWVYDSCIDGATIPTGFYNSSGQFLTRQSGLFLDFQNGRVLSSGNWGPTISGTYSKREFNVQFTSVEVAGLYIDRMFNANSDIDYTQTGAYPYSYTAPIIFVTNANAQNEPYQLGGGVVNSKRAYRLYVITKDAYSQEALVTVLTDKINGYIPILSSEQMPLKFYGDLKTGGFNYCDLKTIGVCGSGAYIEDVFHYKIDQKSNKSNTWFASAYDLQLSAIRNI